MAFSVPELPEIKQTMVSRGRHVGKEGSMFPGRQFDLVWETLWSVPSRVSSTRQQTHAVGRVSRKAALCTWPWCGLPPVQQPQSNFILLFLDVLFTFYICRLLEICQ